jgi:hypothetical protein
VSEQRADLIGNGCRGRFASLGEEVFDRLRERLYAPEVSGDVRLQHPAVVLIG